jgi:23S rRNA (cytosine1962-C5)-methyltransferase
MADSANVAHLPVLRLKRNEDRRLNAGHLWVFSNEVDTQQSPLTRFAPGEIVRVLSHNDRALGLAYVNPKSLICARLLQTWKLPDTDWFVARLRLALALRERLYGAPYYRLAFGESDGLPGLVIDRYGDTCVVQIGTAGMEALKINIEEALRQLLACSTVLFKNDASGRELEGLGSYVEGSGALAAPGKVVEDDLQFEVPLAEGQKTGWFFDQAANRREMLRYLRPGQRVLDVFSYVGAWGVRAAHAGAREVVCVDSSATALELAARNAGANGVALKTVRGDAFDVLEAMDEARERFDLLIIDPPAFAKRRKDVPKALAAYKRLNQLALGLVSDGGFLISCSCSFHLSADDLRDAIVRATRAVGKQVQIVAMGGQAPDHPVHPAIPETRYLKAYYCRVNDGLK